MVAPLSAWLRHVRKHVNFDQLASEAQHTTALVVAGSRRDAFVHALGAAGEPRPDALILCDSLVALPDLAAAARAVVYCPEDESSNGSITAAANLPYAVCVVRSSEAASEGRRMPTTPPAAKPAPGTAVVYHVSAIELAQFRKYLLPDIVRVYREREIAIAAAIPAFRPIVAAKLTADCAMTSLKIAAASAVADHIPVLGLLTGSLASAGDTIAITALQMRMLLRIAAAYGKRPEAARLIELLPVVGGGYAWRALAREASGFIPIAGIPIKAAIAYAGTLVVGQVAAHYYETGLRMPSSAMGAMYREASERARELLRRVTKPPKASGGPPARG